MQIRTTNHNSTARISRLASVQLLRLGSLLAFLALMQCSSSSRCDISSADQCIHINRHWDVIFDGSEAWDTIYWKHVYSDTDGMRLVPTRRFLNNRDSARPQQQQFLQQSLAVVYDEIPNVDECVEGKLSVNERAKILEHINLVRSLHHLPPVVYDCGDDREAQRAALIMLANQQLDHTPPSSWQCWSSAGRDGAEHSNLLGGGYGAPYELQSAGAIVAIWVNDLGIEDVGHRRWILSPFTKSIAIGRVDRVGPNGSVAMYAALRWGNCGEPDTPVGGVEYIACPFEDYPVELCSPWCLASFSVVADSMNLWANESVDFSRAVIHVTDEHDKEVDVTDKHSNNQGYGLPNCLMWKMKAVNVGARYRVNIEHVWNGTEEKSYSYWFRLLPRGKTYQITR